MQINKTKTLFVAYPHGFCAGVSRAINTLEKAIEKFGTPIFVNHPIVHNNFLVNYFKKKGVKFSIPIEKIPKDSILIFSAHGVSPLFLKKCIARGLKIIDTTCPLVLKVHREAVIFKNNGYEIFFIGQKNHQEAKGTSGVAKIKLIENLSDIKKIKSKDFKNKKVVCLTQTTLSVDDTRVIVKELKKKIPHIELTKDICYASQNRQNAVKRLAEKCDFIAVIGSKNSSNANRLVEVAKSFKKKALLFDSAEKIPKSIFKYKKIGLTAGASAPEILLKQVIEKFKKEIPNLEIIELLTAQENTSFPLPENL